MAIQDFSSIIQLSPIPQVSSQDFSSYTQIVPVPGWSTTSNPILTPEEIQVYKVTGRQAIPLEPVVAPKTSEDKTIKNLLKLKGVTPKKAKRGGKKNPYDDIGAWADEWWTTSVGPMIQEGEKFIKGVKDLFWGGDSGNHDDEMAPALPDMSSGVAAEKSMILSGLSYTEEQPQHLDANLTREYFHSIFGLDIPDILINNDGTKNKVTEEKLKSFKIQQSSEFIVKSQEYESKYMLDKSNKRIKYIGESHPTIESNNTLSWIYSPQEKDVSSWLQEETQFKGSSKFMLGGFNKEGNIIFQNKSWESKEDLSEIIPNPIEPTFILGWKINNIGWIFPDKQIKKEWDLSNRNLAYAPENSNPPHSNDIYFRPLKKVEKLTDMEWTAIWKSKSNHEDLMKKDERVNKKLSPAEALLHSGPDFMSNKFDAFFVWNPKEIKESSLGYGNKMLTSGNYEKMFSEYDRQILTHWGFAVRFGGISFPPSYNDEFEISFLETKIKKLKSDKVNENKASFSFRLDQNLIWLDYLERLAGRLGTWSEIFGSTNDLYSKSILQSNKAQSGIEGKIDNINQLLKTVSKTWPVKSFKGKDDLESYGLCLIVKMTHFQDYRNSYSQNRLPFLVFEDVRILGPGGTIDYDKDGGPQDINIEFIFRNSYQVHPFLLDKSSKVKHEDMWVFEKIFNPFGRGNLTLDVLDHPDLNYMINGIQEHKDEISDGILLADTPKTFTDSITGTESMLA